MDIIKNWVRLFARRYVDTTFYINPRGGYNILLDRLHHPTIRAYHICQREHICEFYYNLIISPNIGDIIVNLVEHVLELEDLIPELDNNILELGVARPVTVLSQILG